jgi:hypothetical protein
MAQNIAVGMPVEIKPGITPDIFGGGGVLTRDEYNILDYQTNIANVEKIGSVNNPDLPAGTVLVCHGTNCSMYSINHIRPYNPENNNSRNNRRNNNRNNANNNPSVTNTNNSKNNSSNNPTTENDESGLKLFGVKLFGGRRRKYRKTARKSRKYKKNTRRN